MPILHSAAFLGAMLERGFWRYVWEIVAADGKIVLHLGRTGDSSSPNAQSPLNRLSQHLGSNKHANALRRQLEAAGIEPDTCRSIDLGVCGPILPEAQTMAEHEPRRNQVAGMKKALRDALHRAGYTALNKVQCLQLLDGRLWQDVQDAFASRFPKLNSKTVAVDTTR